MTSPVSVAAAVGAAVSFAVAAVVQQESTQLVPVGKSLSLRILADLLRRPKWLAGVAFLLCGFGLQALALAYGPVALVQPIVVTELAFAIPLAIWRRRRRAGRREVLGIGCVVAGVATFLVASSPRSGIPDPGGPEWLLSLAPAGGVATAAVALGSRRSGPVRALLLGAASGISFGVLAVLTKATTYLLGLSLDRAFSSWQLYLVVVVGIAALVVSQSAYQAGPLAYSLPVSDVLEPVVAVVLGQTMLGEQVTLSPGLLALEAVAAAIACAGIVVLATSSTVLGIYRDA